MGLKTLLQLGNLIIGVVTSYTDIRYQSIKNRHLFLAGVFALCVNVLGLIIKQPGFDINSFLFNIFLSIIVAYALYFKNLWSAGDSKLFIIMSLMAPPLNSISPFQAPCIFIFINSVMICFIYIIIYNFFGFLKSLRKGITTDKSLIKARLNSLTLAVLFTFSLNWLIIIALLKLNLENNFLNFLILYLLYFLFRKIINKAKTNKFYLLGFILFGIILRLIIQPSLFLSSPYLIRYILATIVYSLLFEILDIFSFPFYKKDRNNRAIAFAPFIFAGAIITNLGNAYFFLDIISLLKNRLF